MGNSKRKAHCGKVKYRTMAAAKAARRRTLEASVRRKAPIVTELTAYSCPYCDGFHVGRDIVKGINWQMVKQHDEALRKLARGAAK